MTPPDVDSSPDAVLDLLDWRRRVSEMYAEVRRAPDPRGAWEGWRRARHELIASHPQSPIADPEARSSFGGVAYFHYDPGMRVLADVVDAEPERVEIPGSAEGAFTSTRFAAAAFRLGDVEHRLALYWLEGYGGGLFLSFRDETSGRETYGAGRYLLDTVKGADLGTTDGKLVLDFNFSYNPSCSYDPRWACPLAPPENRLSIPVRAGERLAGAG